MKSEALKQKDSQIAAGLFSKKDVASYLVAGKRHIHSSMLGDRDPNVEVTQKLIEGQEARYFWEEHSKIESIELQSSDQRRGTTKKIIESVGVPNNSFNQKLMSVLEELITNAFYHSYTLGDGAPKYPRGKIAEVTEQEAIRIQYAWSDEGVYLAVEDNGGSFEFDKIVSAFERCYSKAAQVDSKPQGAGLGLYLTFELVMHLKIEVRRNQSTRVSCWVPGPKRFDPDHFSMNYFQRGESDA